MNEREMNGEDADAGLAAEFVLHLLDADERRQAEERLSVDSAFRARVAEWTEDLAALADDVDAVAPPPRVRASLVRMVSVGSGERAADSARPTARGRSRGGLRRIFGGGLGALTGLAAAVLVLAVVLPTVEGPQTAAPAYTGELAGAGSGLLFQARFSPDTGVLTVDRRAGEAPAGRVLELWLIAEEGSAPVSLGVVPEEGTAQIPLPADLAALLPEATLAFTDEPPGGAPAGIPTGEILAAGQVSAS